MSGRIALREELTAHARRQAERMNATRRAVVKSLSPITVEFFGSSLVLTEDNDFWLSQAMTYYNQTVGIKIDDVVLMHEQYDWVLFDIVTDTPMTPKHVGASVTLEPTAAPASPTSGYVLYTDKADGKLKAKSSSGQVTILAPPYNYFPGN